MTVTAWTLRYRLREWQLEAAARWSAAGGRGIVRVVTGAGKTVFGLHIASGLIRAKNAERILVIVPSLVLLDQWKVAFQQDLGVDPGDIACFGTGFPKNQGSRRVNLAVINTAREIAPSLVHPEPARWLLVADECHRYGSGVNSQALKLPYGYTLGLSATPEREFDEGFERHLEPNLGPVVFEYDYAMARKDEVITPFRLLNYRIPLMPREAAAYDEATKKIAIKLEAVRREFAKKGLAPPSLRTLLTEKISPEAVAIRNLLLRRRSVAINAGLRPAAAVKIALSSRGKKALIFHERIESADKIQQLASAAGLTATVYHSELSSIRRSNNLMQFRMGVCNVLVTCRALDEGLDVPEAEVGIIAASTRSTRQRIQRMGRVLRQSEKKSEASVATIYATDAEHEDLVRETAKLRDVALVEWFDLRIGSEARNAR